MSGVRGSLAYLDWTLLRGSWGMRSPKTPYGSTSEKLRLYPLGCLAAQSAFNSNGSNMD